MNEYTLVKIIKILSWIVLLLAFICGGLIYKQGRLSQKYELALETISDYESRIAECKNASPSAENKVADLESVADSGNAGNLENEDMDNEDATDDVSLDEEGDKIHALSVKNGRIVDENGNVFQLRGMSSHGLYWFPEYTGYEAVATTKEYGANAFRIAMYANEPNGGYIQDRERSLSLLHSAVESVKAAGMYAVIDWHILNEHNPLYDVEAAKEFFRNTASMYGNDPQIIYEICNEPNNEATWDNVKDYANQVIPIIRQYAPDCLIIVGTPNYSYSVKSAINNQLDYDNLLYSFHFYAGQFPNEYPDILTECKNAGVPVIISEWGINTDCDANARVYGQDFLNYINSNNISWFAWSLCNKNECFSAIKSDCQKLSGWEMDDLTEVGRIFFKGFE